MPTTPATLSAAQQRFYDRLRTIDPAQVQAVHAQLTAWRDNPTAPNLANYDAAEWDAVHDAADEFGEAYAAEQGVDPDDVKNLVPAALTVVTAYLDGAAAGA